MGNSIIWYYPPGASGPKEIDFGRKVSSLDLQFTRSVSDAVPLGGSSLRHDRGGTRRVRIAAERLVSAALINELRSLETHLLAGYAIAFVVDKDRAWGSWATSAPSAGAITIGHGGNAFTAFNSSATLVSGNVVSVESPNPEYRYELVTVDTITSGSLALSTAIRGDFGIEPVFVRWADFFPTLRLPQDRIGSTILTTDRRLNWSLDLTLEERPGDIEALYEEAEALLVQGQNYWEGTTLETKPFTGAGV
jgi:hypothetical protein